MPYGLSHHYARENGIEKDSLVYFARYIPITVFESSFHIDFDPMATERAETTPCVALEIADGKIKAIGYVTEFHFKRGLPWKAKRPVVDKYMSQDLDNADKFQVTEGRVEYTDYEWLLKSDDELDQYNYVLIPFHAELIKGDGLAPLYEHFPLVGEDDTELTMYLVIDMNRQIEWSEGIPGEVW